LAFWASVLKFLPPAVRNGAEGWSEHRVYRPDDTWSIIPRLWTNWLPVFDGVFQEEAVTHGCCRSRCFARARYWWHATVHAPAIGVVELQSSGCIGLVLRQRRASGSGYRAQMHVSDPSDSIRCRRHTSWTRPIAINVPAEVGAFLRRAEAWIRNISRQHADFTTLVDAECEFCPKMHVTAGADPA